MKVVRDVDIILGIFSQSRQSLVPITTQRHRLPLSMYMREKSSQENKMLVKFYSYLTPEVKKKYTSPNQTIRHKSLRWLSRKG